jgi:hypothetical protein
MFKILKSIPLYFALLASQLCYCQATFHRRDERKEKATIITVSGFVLTSAAVLDNLNKGQWVNTVDGRKYVYPNIITNSPQNIMFGVGVSLTIGGLFSFKHKY